jgi:hypothetical protein
VGKYFMGRRKTWGEKGLGWFYLSFAKISAVTVLSTTRTKPVHMELSIYNETELH